MAQSRTCCFPERSPSVVIPWGEPWRFGTFFMKGRSGRLFTGFGNVALEELALVIDRPPEIDR